MPENNLKRLLIITILISLFFLVIPASANTGWEKTVISLTGTDAQGGMISGDNIVYLGSEGFNQSMNRIYLYSIKTGEQEIIGIPEPEMTVTGQRVSGDYIVWFETTAIEYDMNSGENNPNKICLCSVGEVSKKVLKTPGTAEWPKIHGKKIVYSIIPGSSSNCSLYIYDIKMEKSEQLIDISPDADNAGIIFDGDNIAWQDGEGLFIYNIESGERTTAYSSVYGNKSGSNVGSFDLNGDYLVYLRHIVEYEGPDKGMYDLPSLYTLSTGETKLISPKTEEYVSSLHSDERKLLVISPFTDGRRIGWAYSDNSPDSTIVLLNPSTGGISTIPVNGSVSQIFMEDGRIVWSESHFPSFSSQLVYAEENGKNPVPSPGFTSIGCILALSASLVILLITGRW